MKAVALLLLVVAFLLAGCGSNPRHYSVAQVKAAFATQGFLLSQDYAGQPFPATGVVRLADHNRFVLVEVWPGEVKNPPARKELQKGNVAVIQVRSMPLVVKVVKALQQLR